jgi:sulfur transfer complex TusBCD TusB component (DsrH family)
MGLLDIIRDMQKQKEIAKTNLEKSSRTQKGLTGDESICINNDTEIRKLDVLISDITKRNIKANRYGSVINDYTNRRTALKKDFINRGCADVLEKKKLLESANVLGTNFSRSEDDILEKSRKEQNKLYALGGGILLLGLILIVRK